MVIQKNKAYCFIHVPKTGGDAITAALQRRTNCTVYRDHRKHATVREVRAEFFGDGLFGRCFKFGFVRNPFEQVHSDYWFCRTARINPQWRKWAYLRGWIAKCDRARKQTFLQFVQTVCSQGIGLWEHYLSDRHGTDLVNFVGRHERIAEDWTHIQRRLGLAIESLPRKNVTHGRPADYRIDYTDAAKDLVARRFRNDLRRFDYEF